MITGTLHKTRFAEIGFTMSTPGRWRFVDITDAQDGNKNNMHEIGAAYPTKEQIMLQIESFATEYGCEGANKPNLQTPPDALLQQIARDYLGIKTLDMRNLDALDFHSIAVWNIKTALEAAWKAGVTTAWKASQ